MKKIILNYGPLAVVGLLAVLIAGLLTKYDTRHVIKHQQFIIGEREPGQIPDSEYTDRYDNTTYYFRPIPKK